MNAPDIVIILHNIRSSHNVGSILRTADGGGASQVYLTGYTPRPVDRFGRPNKDIAKTALGAETSVPWKAYRSLSQLMKELKKKKFLLVAFETGGKAREYTRVKYHSPTALFFGNETKGLSPRDLRLADVVAEIPMQGKKESLNVSVTAGIALYRVREFLMKRRS